MASAHSYRRDVRKSGSPKGGNQARRGSRSGNVGTTEDMLGMNGAVAEEKTYDPNEERISNLQKQIGQLEAKLRMTVDGSGLALALFEVFKSSAWKLVWYARSDDEYRIYALLAEGRGTSLLFDFLPQSPHETFTFVASNDVYGISNGDPGRGLSADNMMSVIRELATLAKQTVGNMVVQANIKKWNGWSDNWVEPDKWQIVLLRRDGQLHVRVSFNRTNYNLDTLDAIRCEVGGAASQLRLEYEASERRVLDLQNQISSLEKHESKLSQRVTRNNQYIERIEREKRTAENAQSQLTQKNNEMRRKVERLEEEKKSADRRIREAQRNVSSLRTQMSQKERSAENLKKKNRDLLSENRRVEREAGELSQANRRYEDIQRDFENKKAQFESYKKAQDGLQQENSRLRDKISDLRGGSRRLGSKFWTKKEVVSALGELSDEYHFNVMSVLGEKSDIEKHEVLWQVLMAVRQSCELKFEEMQRILCMERGGALRNEFMGKIQEYFEELVDKDGIRMGVCQEFEEVLGNEVVENETFLEFVDACTNLCWVMALKSDPAMEFFPLQWECGDAVYTKQEFKSKFHSDSRGLKKAKNIQFVNYVLPGLRNVATGNVEALPCVVGMKAADDAAVESAAEAVDEKRDDVPGAVVDEEVGEAGDEDAKSEGATPMSEDEDVEESGEMDIQEKIAEKFDQICHFLSEGAGDDAFSMLEECGLDMKSGKFKLVLTCVECGESAGEVIEDDDDFGCDDTNHLKVEIANIVAVQ